MEGHHNTTKAIYLSAHHTLYEVPQHLERARYRGFQTLDVEHQTDSRCPLDQPPGTTTETDEDGLTLGTSEVAAPYSGRHPRVMTMEADEDGDR